MLIKCILSNHDYKKQCLFFSIPPGLFLFTNNLAQMTTKDECFTPLMIMYHMTDHQPAICVKEAILFRIVSHYKQQCVYIMLTFSTKGVKFVDNNRPLAPEKRCNYKSYRKMKNNVSLLYHVF